MSGCGEVQARFTEYLDGRLNGREMQVIAPPGGLPALRPGVGVVAPGRRRRWPLGPVPEPEDLLLRIRVAVSQERARSRREPFHGWNLAWKNTVGPFLLQAGAGLPARCCCWVRSLCWSPCLRSRRWRRPPRTSRWAIPLRRG
jgi:hypothetical protein